MFVLPVVATATPEILYVDVCIVRSLRESKTCMYDAQLSDWSMLSDLLVQCNV